MQIRKNNNGGTLYSIDPSLTTVPVTIRASSAKAAFPVSVAIGKEMASMDKEGIKEMIEALVKCL
jgi:hypothetical protein